MTSIPDDLLKIDEQAEASRLSRSSKAFEVLLERGDLSVELFVPRGTDTQSSHERDEVYIVSSGTGLFRRDRDTVEFRTGDLLFVPAGVDHWFERFSANFRTWVIFFGPRGGVQN